LLFHTIILGHFHWDCPQGLFTIYTHMYNVVCGESSSF
jgi:hypothetical protein